MKTFRIERPCNPGKLHIELQNAGVPVITVRASHAPEDLADLAMFAVVVTEDNVPANIAEIINSHVEHRKPSLWTPCKGQTAEDLLRNHERL